MRISKSKLSSRLLLATLASTFIGCATLSDVREDVGISRNAKKAYRARAHSLSSNSHHFENGWKQAYYEVSKGGDPCPPSIPPKHYWSDRYQSARGRKFVAEWYAGYSAGVSAAQCDCRDVYSELPSWVECQRESAIKCEVVPEKRGWGSESFVGGEIETICPGGCMVRLPEVEETPLMDRSIEYVAKAPEASTEIASDAPVPRIDVGSAQIFFEVDQPINETVEIANAKTALKSPEIPMDLVAQRDDSVTENEEAPPIGPVVKYVAELSVLQKRSALDGNVRRVSTGGLTGLDRREISPLIEEDETETENVDD